MNKQKWMLFVVVVLMMCGTVGVLARLGSQALGKPGVKTRSSGTNSTLEVILPETVLDYSSEVLEQQQIVRDTLPKDTSFGQRRYKAPDGFFVQVNVVLMGTDRTSIHKPQVCMTGSGWKIDPKASAEEIVHMDKPVPYDLHVMKLIASKQVEQDGQVMTLNGIYVYWFVADDALTAKHTERMWSMAKNLLERGVLQRWAYVSYFTPCIPGQEQVSYERLKKLIVASVPEFQLVPNAGQEAALNRP